MDDSINHVFVGKISEELQMNSLRCRSSFAHPYLEPNKPCFISSFIFDNSTNISQLPFHQRYIQTWMNEQKNNHLLTFVFAACFHNFPPIFIPEDIDDHFLQCITSAIDIGNNGLKTVEYALMTMSTNYDFRHMNDNLSSTFTVRSVWNNALQFNAINKNIFHKYNKTQVYDICGCNLRYMPVSVKHISVTPLALYLRVIPHQPCRVFSYKLNLGFAVLQFLHTSSHLECDGKYCEIVEDAAEFQYKTFFFVKGSETRVQCERVLDCGIIVGGLRYNMLLYSDVDVINKQCIMMCQRLLPYPHLTLFQWYFIFILFVV